MWNQTSRRYAYVIYSLSFIKKKKKKKHSLQVHGIRCEESFRTKAAIQDERVERGRKDRLIYLCVYIGCTKALKDRENAKTVATSKSFILHNTHTIEYREEVRTEG